MAEEIKEYLDYEGLSEYHKKSEELFQDLTIEEVEEAFNELDESDPSYSAFYDVITKAKEANARTDEVIAQAETATTNANEATSKADEATDRANKAAEKLETVNDFTTGINLLRKSRDFGQGTVYKQHGTEATNHYEDGFNNLGKWTFSKDDEGFTIAHNQASGLSSDSTKYLNFPLFTVNPGDVITFSFEFMIEDVSIWDRKFLFNISAKYPGNNTNQIMFDVSPSVVGVSNVESGVWYQAIYKMTTYQLNQAATVGIKFYLLRNGAINLKKPMVQIGNINHPIYAPNPNDVDYINDITTGENLLRGTRDFKIGTTKGSSYLNATLYKDGFYNQSTDVTSFYKDEDGFTVLKIAQSGVASANYKCIRSSAIQNVKAGDTYTISFEFMIEDIDALNKGTTLIALFEYYNNKQATRAGVAELYYSKLGFTVESKKWYSAVFYVTVAESVDGCAASLLPCLVQNGAIHFKKLDVNTGKINHPIYALNPNDIDYINDETTGINLLRGTRDFTAGTIQNSKNSFLQNNGFKEAGTAGEINFSKGLDGFSIARLKTSIVKRYYSSPIEDLEPGEVLTIAVDYCVHSDVSINTNIVEAAFYNGKTGENSIYYTLESSKVTKEQWSTAKRCITVPSGYNKDTWLLTIALMFPSNIDISFKMLRVYKDNINNPIWSASPFDVAQVSDFNTTKNYDVTNLITVPEGFNAPSFATLRTTGNKIVQLYVEVTSKNSITQGTSFQPITIDSSIRPVIHCFAGGPVIIGTINSTNGIANFTALAEIKANTVIQICCTYVLNNGFAPLT